MTTSSLLKNLLQDLPHLRTQMYFKASLTALSHAMEDLVLAGSDAPLMIANFQQERFYRQESRRYRQIAQRTDQIYVLAAPEAESGFAIDSTPYEVIPLDPKDKLSQEWHLVIVGPHYCACLVCRERPSQSPEPSMEQIRRYEGFWTFDRQTSLHAARLLLGRIAQYRPELEANIEQAWQQYGLAVDQPQTSLIPSAQAIDSSIFGQRLMTYLQAGQYKLLKAYQAIAAQEQRERLLNVITVAIRNSFEPPSVLQTTVQELGQTFPDCRCLLYCCQPTDTQVTIEYESVPTEVRSLRGEPWPLTENPLIQAALAQDRAIAIPDVENAPNLTRNSALRTQIQRNQIRSWLLAPIRYRGNLLGMIEIQSRDVEARQWRDQDIGLVEAVANQAGIALTQTQNYADLETLNHQLETLERTQRNLIAIVGHELRTPLSTIQICLESIATEPDMPVEFFETMLDTALEDTGRMRKLIQNFLTLSRLESGQEALYPEPIQVQEAITLALSSFKPRLAHANAPKIKLEVPSELPSARVDGRGLVEVLTQLLENACKFTGPEGEIMVRSQVHLPKQPVQLASTASRSTRRLSVEPMLEFTVADTGRGIEASQLDAIFNRFSQEEDYLQRTAAGAGLGLAICRHIIQNMGGTIWAESDGRDQGSQFHFTVPIE